MYDLSQITDGSMHKNGEQMAIITGKMEQDGEGWIRYKILEKPAQEPTLN